MKEENKMNLTPWKPMNELLRIHDEMDGVFEDFFGKRSLLRPAEGGDWEWMPAVDITETDDYLEVRADIPGVTEKEMTLSVTDNVLTLRGAKKRESEEKGENYHRVERSYGRFQRSFTLPKNLQTDKTAATFKNGVLTVSIPKVEEIKPKAVPILTE
jgi:HSP20 family protein